MSAVRSTQRTPSSPLAWAAKTASASGRDRSLTITTEAMPCPTFPSHRERTGSDAGDARKASMSSADAANSPRANVSPVTVDRRASTSRSTREVNAASSSCRRCEGSQSLRARWPPTDPSASMSRSRATSRSSRCRTCSASRPCTRKNCAGLGMPSSRPTSRCWAISSAGDDCRLRRSSFPCTRISPGTATSSTTTASAMPPRRVAKRGQRASVPPSQREKPVVRT